MSTRGWWRWVGLFGLALPLVAACGSEEPRFEIQDFRIDRAEPPLDPGGRMPTVVPGSTVHLSWKVAGAPDRLVLTADDRKLATWSRGKMPSSWVDPCGASRQASSCSTRGMGEVTYRLQAFQGRKETSRALSVRVAEQGMRILSFTSRQVEDPSHGSSDPRVELTWAIGGAIGARLSASPIGGGATRELGLFSMADAEAGSLLDEGIEASTLYRLEAQGLLGDTAVAEIAVTLNDEAFLTSLVADPPNVAPGGETTLRWKSTGLERLMIVRDDGGETLAEARGQEVDEGSRRVVLTRKATFTFVGVSKTGAVIEEVCDGTGCRPAKLTVELKPPPTVIQFQPDLREIVFGSATQLRWNVEHAEEVIVSWADASGDHERRSNQAAGALQVEPTQSTRYTLVAGGAGRTASRTASVLVRPAAQLQVHVDPAYGGAYAGEELSMSWSTAGASLVDILADGLPIPLGDGAAAAGTVALPVSAGVAEGSSLSLELIARNDETPRRSTRVEVPVSLHRRPHLDRISFSPLQIDRGQTSLLSWQTTDAVGLRLSPPAPSRAGTVAWVELDAADLDVMPQNTGGFHEVDLPFHWNGFQGVRIHENGWLSFGTADTLEAKRGGAAVAPLLGGFGRQAGSSIRMRADGDRVIVSWTQMGRTSRGGDDLTFQAILGHDGNAQVGWKRLRLVDGGDPRLLATVGITVDVPSLGLSLLRWSHREAAGPQENTALRFASGILPATGSLEVMPLSDWQPTGWALGAAAPPAPHQPETLQVTPPRDR